jgi:hypothetical protein
MSYYFLSYLYYYITPSLQRALHAFLLCFAHVRDVANADGFHGNDDDEISKSTAKSSKGAKRAVSASAPLLLEQYQLQLSAVLKSAFAGDEVSTHPQARAAACSGLVCNSVSGWDEVFLDF